MIMRRTKPEAGRFRDLSPALLLTGAAPIDTGLAEPKESRGTCRHSQIFLNGSRPKQHEHLESPEPETVILYFTLKDEAKAVGQKTTCRT